MRSRKDIIEELLECFASMKRSMAVRGLGGKHGQHITPSQWSVLMLIEQHGDMSLRDVAEALTISSSAATQLVDGLVTNGYVVRKKNTKDRRAISLSLSKRAKGQVGTMRHQAVKKFLEVFRTLSDKELSQYCTLTKKITQKFLIQYAK